MNRIREVRLRAGIAQADLYRKIGWKQARLANYENGTREPALNDCRRIVAALNALGVDCALKDVFPEPSDLRSCHALRPDIFGSAGEGQVKGKETNHV